jgi:ABC-type Na+ efflux pump permease subunit
MNRKIIIALIVIVLIALAGLLAFSSGIKSDTQITSLSGNNLKNGDQVQFELKDAQGNVLSNQNVEIVYGANGENQTFSIITDSEGRGGLLLNEQADGNYNISVKYAGDDKHNGCSANTTITIGEGSTETANNSASYSQDSTQATADSSASYASSSSGQSSSSQSSDLSYDSELNEYYDSNGKIVGGQNDGASYEQVKNNRPQISEDGGLE